MKFIAGLATLTLLSICTNFAAPVLKDWAYFGYFVGDEKDSASLETSQVRDMIELKDGMRHNNIHVMVQHDRGTKLNSTLKNFYRDPNYSGAMRFEIKSDGVYSGRKLGELNMGDAQAFYEFLDYGMRNYPARRVVVGVNAHGSGILSWSGPTAVRDDKDYDDVHLVDPFVGYDATGDNLTIFEFRKVLERIQSRYPQNKIEVIIFDACLSAMVEVMSELKDVTRVVIGSAETIPGTGLNYSAVTRALEANVDAKRFSEYVTESYINSVSGDNVIGAWDLSRMHDYEQALNQMSFEMIKALRTHSKRGFRNLSNYSDSYWDIRDVAVSIVKGNSDLSDVTSLRTAAQSLIDAQLALDIVVWRQGKYARSDSHGLSIFWPDKKNYNAYRRFYKKLKFSKNFLWDNFLDSFILGMDSDIERFEHLYGEE